MDSQAWSAAHQKAVRDLKPFGGSALPSWRLGPWRQPVCAARRVCCQGALLRGRPRCCRCLQVNAFRAIIATTPEDLLPAVYLCTNRVGPSHEGLELGVGDSILMKVCAACRALCGWTTLALLSMDDQPQAGGALWQRRACLQSSAATPDPWLAQIGMVLVKTFCCLAASGHAACTAFSSR